MGLVNPSFMHAFISCNTQESWGLGIMGLQTRMQGIRPSGKLPRSPGKQLAASGSQLRPAQSHRAEPSLHYSTGNRNSSTLKVALLIMILQSILNNFPVQDSPAHKTDKSSTAH